MSTEIQNTIYDVRTLFAEAKAKNEFEFVLTLLNYQGIAPEISPTLLEWFGAIEFYKTLYYGHQGKEKARIAALLYSTFFENSDFYNIIGSLCRIKLGYKGSPYLFWKTRRYDRLLGIGEKQDFLTELLADCGKENLIDFFNNKHHKEIRNTFFHAAYSLDDEEYHLHDSEAVTIDRIGHYSLNLKDYFYPLVEDIINFFDNFKRLYEESWASYQEDKQVLGLFPNIVMATIIGSSNGLQGFRIKNSINLYGTWHDSGIWYDEKNELWAGHNIRITHQDKESIEIDDQLKRFEDKVNINRSDVEFNNLIDKVKERQQTNELARAVRLLEKFGDVRKQMMDNEQDQFKKKSYPKMILPFYRQAIEIGDKTFNMETIAKKIKEIENQA